MLNGVEVEFRNIPRVGSLETIKVADCLIANSGSPAGAPEITVHLPKTFSGDVNGGWVNYEGNEYHVVGVTVKGIDANTPSRWNRYAIARANKFL